MHQLQRYRQDQGIIPCLTVCASGPEWQREKGKGGESREGERRRGRRVKRASIRSHHTAAPPTINAHPAFLTRPYPAQTRRGPVSPQRSPHRPPGQQAGWLPPRPHTTLVACSPGPCETQQPRATRAPASAAQPSPTDSTATASALLEHREQLVGALYEQHHASRQPRAVLLLRRRRIQHEHRSESEGRGLATYACVGTLEEVEVVGGALRLRVVHQLRVGLDPHRALREGTTENGRLSRCV